MRAILLSALCGFTLLAGSRADQMRPVLERTVQAKLAPVLEQRFSRAELLGGEPIVGIVVLGGQDSRVKHAIELARRFPSALIVASGPGPGEERTLKAEPALAGRLIVDRRAANTFENAQLSAPLIGIRPTGRWVVVTSAFHMPRSMGAFKQLGLELEPWPVYDLPKDAHRAAGLLIREAAALAYYRLLGRTTAILPGPPQFDRRSSRA